MNFTAVKSSNLINFELAIVLAHSYKVDAIV
jgi:hypothetical protein